jgi:hypothetical protein
VPDPALVAGPKLGGQGLGPGFDGGARSGGSGQPRPGAAWASCLGAPRAVWPIVLGADHGASAAGGRPGLGAEPGMGRPFRQESSLNFFSGATRDINQV